MSHVPRIKRSRKRLSFEKRFQNFQVASECLFLTFVREENNVNFVIKVGSIHILDVMACTKGRQQLQG